MTNKVMIDVEFELYLDALEGALRARRAAGLGGGTIRGVVVASMDELVCELDRQGLTKDVVIIPEGSYGIRRRLGRALPGARGVASCESGGGRR